MNAYRTGLRVGLAGAVLAMAMSFPGCRAGVPVQLDGSPRLGGDTDFGKYKQSPKPRLGGLPYPGLFTLFELADPQKLGKHSYDNQIGQSEKDRGIVYTCRGGFIDLAHAQSMDLCKYVAVRAEVALANDWPGFQVKGLEPSVYVVRLTYPPFWASLGADEKKQLAHELAIRMGPRIAMLMVTWHEILTWFGYQSTPIASEKASAFTYDDTGAHAFGTLVGGRALRRSDVDWDQAVTEEILHTLKELEVVTPKEAMEAIEQVKGAWWEGAEPVRRHVESGLDGHPIVAWIVPHLPFCSNDAPYSYELPRLDDVAGRNFANLVHIEIRPNVFQTGDIRHSLPGSPAQIDADRDVPILMSQIR